MIVDIIKAIMIVFFIGLTMLFLVNIIKLVFKVAYDAIWSIRPNKFK